MPFPKGQKMSPESNAKRRTAMLARIAAGRHNAGFHAKGFTPEVIARRVATQKANGSTERAVRAMNASMSRPDVRAKLSASRKARMQTEEGKAHVRKMQAGTQTPAVNERRALASRAYALTVEGHAAKVRGGNAALKSLQIGAASRRWDGYRSSYELTFARFLTGLGVPFEYEPETFRLPDGSCYTPDFLVRIPGQEPVWVEVKGAPYSTRKFWAFKAAISGRAVLLGPDEIAAL